MSSTHINSLPLRGLRTFITYFLLPGTLFKLLSQCESMMFEVLSGGSYINCNNTSTSPEEATVESTNNTVVNQPDLTSCCNPKITPVIIKNLTDKK